MPQLVWLRRPGSASCCSAAVNRLATRHSRGTADWQGDWLCSSGLPSVPCTSPGCKNDVVRSDATTLHRQLHTESRSRCGLGNLLLGLLAMSRLFVLKLLPAWAFAHARIPTMFHLWIGPMASGKSQALITAAVAARSAGRQLVLARPAIDTRGAADAITSRTGAIIQDVHGVHSIHAVRDLVPVVQGLSRLHRCTVVLDELHFLPDAGLVIPELTASIPGCEVLAAGLDMDFRGQPFESVAACQDWAAKAAGCVVHKLTAACAKCGEPAAFTQRLDLAPSGQTQASAPPAAGASGRIAVGDVGMYQPACSAHHTDTICSAQRWWSNSDEHGATRA